MRLRLLSPLLALLACTTGKPGAGECQTTNDCPVGLGPCMSLPLSGDAGTFCACQHPPGSPPRNPTAADIATGHACWGVCDGGNCGPCHADADCDWMATAGTGVIATCRSGSCTDACPSGEQLIQIFDGGSACIRPCVTATDCVGWMPPESCAVPDSGADAPFCTAFGCTKGCGGFGQPCCCLPLVACHDPSTICSGRDGPADHCCLLQGIPCTQSSDCCSNLCSGGFCTMGIP